MNIGEAAGRSGLPAKTIRYYEAIGLVVPSGRQGNNYRDYSEQDIHLLRFVARARSLGFSVENCRDLLGLYRDQGRASADVKALAQARIQDIERKIEELEAMRETLRHLVARCQGDDRPDCPILSNLAASRPAAATDDGGGCAHPAEPGAEAGMPAKPAAKAGASAKPAAGKGRMARGKAAARIA